MAMTPGTPVARPPYYPPPTPQLHPVPSEANMLAMRSNSSGGISTSMVGSKNDVQIHRGATNNSGDAEFERVKSVIFKIIAIAINAFAIWKVGYLWSVSFFIGVVFRHEVKSRITDLVSSILDDTTLAVSILVPGTFFFYCFEWPAALTVQAALSGADAGSRVALTIEQYLKSNGGSLLWFIRP